MRKVLCELGITSITKHTAMNFSVKASVVTCSGSAKIMLLPNGKVLIFTGMENIVCSFPVSWVIAVIDYFE